jgi:hypothetical protein
MKAKPSVDVWVLGGLTYEWYRSLSKSALPPDNQLIESEMRSYHLLRSPGLAACRANILLLSFHEILSPELRAILLLAGCYTKELAVIVCKMRGVNEEDKDEEEGGLRDELSELGFQADNIFFYHEPSLLPSPDALSAVLSAFDQRDLSRATSLDTAPFPQGPDRIRAELYRLTQMLASPAVKLSLIKSSAASHQLSTRFGGMPYLEQGEEWPSCKSCQKPLGFLFQIDASQDLKPAIDGAGLFSVYACGGSSHIRQSPQLTLRHHAAPSAEKAQPRRAEASQKFASTGKAIAACAVNRRIELQGPSLREVESMNGLDEYKESNQSRIFRLLSPLSGIEPNPMSYEGVYSEALSTIGANEPEHFTFNNEHALQIGGYFDLGDNVSPLCARCEKVMRLLAHIHEIKGLSFPFRDHALQLFICPCAPTSVQVMNRRESSEERYSREYE